MWNKFTAAMYRMVLVITMIFCVFICMGTIMKAHDNVFEEVFSSTMRFVFPMLLAVMICLFIALLFHCFDTFNRGQLVISSCIMFGIMILILGIILYNFRVVPYTDALSVQDTALYLARTGSKALDEFAPDVGYYAIYANNNFLTVMLALFFKALIKSGIEAVNLPLLLLTASGVVVAAVFMYLIGIKIGGIRTAAKILALCVLNPVYYVLVLWVYSNVLCIPFMMAIIYFGICIYQETHTGRQIILCILETVISVIGYLLRPTTVIPLLALIICAIFWGFRSKRNLRRFIQCAVVCIFVGVGLFKAVSSWSNSYFSSVQDNTFPITHWLMIGSHGTGEYSSKDLSYTISFATKEEKTAATTEKTIENYSKYTPSEFVEFICDKLWITWSYGDGGDLLYKISQDTRQTSLYSWIQGSKSDLFRTYCYAYRMTTFFLLIIALYHLLGRKAKNWYQFLFILSFLGIIIFYCFWEVKNSYSACFIYILLLVGLQGGNVLAQKVADANPGRWMRKNHLSIYAGLACILIVFILSYNGMVHTTVTQTDWVLYSQGNNSLGNVRTDIENATILQEFYASKPFSYIKLRGAADEIGEEENCSYHVTVLDENNVEEYSGDIFAEDIASNGVVKIDVGKIVPKGKEKYTLQLVRSESYKGKIYFRQRANKYVDMYEGMLTVDGTEQVSDLWIQVYNEYDAPWCSRKLGFLINGGLFTAVLILSIWLRQISSGKKAA